MPVEEKKASEIIKPAEKTTEETVTEAAATETPAVDDSAVKFDAAVSPDCPNESASLSLIPLLLAD